MKKLIVAAVAAAVIAPAAAMASATMYGKIHMGVAGFSGTEITMGSHSSRVGIKGSEKLDNGLSVSYGMEWAVRMEETTAGSDLTQRKRFVALGGGFGTVIMGKIDTPFKTIGRKVELFGERLGDFRQLSSAGNVDNSFVNDVIAYATPNFGGVSAVLAVSLSEDKATATTASADNIFTSSIMYKNGPVYAALGYNDFGTGQHSSYRLVGSFEMGAAKVVGGYTNTDYDTAGVADYSSYHLGAQFKMGANTIKAQYTAADNNVANVDPRIIALGFEHKMSKRTTMYANIAKANDATLGTGGGQGYTTTGINTDPTGYSVGIIHNF